MKIKKRLSNLKVKILDSKIYLFITITILAALIGVGLDLLDDDFTFHDILVEYHGLVYDLIVFGILLTIYEAIRDKKDKITRYKEEIDDFRFWHSDESMHRIKGSVNRLEKLGVNSIDLSMCEFSNPRWLNQYKKMRWDFSGAVLKECLFLMVDISTSRFRITDLTNGAFVKTNISGCNFAESILIGTSFEECDLTDIDFKGAKVDRPDWIEYLEKNNNSGIDYIKETFVVESYGLKENFDYIVLVKTNAKQYKVRSVYDW